eukprot:scaffold226701_cov31-Tisochrysis_lutea.AAC.2
MGLHHRRPFNIRLWYAALDAPSYVPRVTSAMAMADMSNPRRIIQAIQMTIHVASPSVAGCLCSV